MSLSIHTQKVEPESIRWQIFDSAGKFEETGYQISGIIEPDGNGGCEITNVQGDMTNESNELMAITVRDMGFDYLIFKAIKGSKVTHYAEYVKTDEHFDFYKVQLKHQTTDDGR